MQSTHQTEVNSSHLWITRIAFNWRSLVAFLIPLILYLLTFAPTIYNLDSAELTTAAATGGLTRATGYPLYLLIGGIWARIPLGDVGYRMNLLSAVCGAATICFADRILCRLRVGPWAAGGALGLLACAPYFWSLSLIAEVYTLHTALMAGIILLLLRWAERPSPTRLATITLLGGLSMGHHLATTMLIPGCLCFVLCVAPRRVIAPCALALALVTGLLGLSIYLYLPFLATFKPAFNYAGSYNATGQFIPLNLSDPRNLWWLLSGGQFSGQMFGYSLSSLSVEVYHFGIQLAQSFFIFGIVPGIIGSIALFRRHWQLGLALLLMFFFNAGFYISYRVIDKDTMFLPAYLIWAIWLGFGYQRILDWIGEDEAVRHSQLMMGGVIIALVMVVCLWNWPLTNRANDTSARLRGERVLTSVAPDALIIGWWETVPLVEYLQLVEGQRPDVHAINRFLISYDDLMTLIKNESARRPTYIDSPTNDMLRAVRIEPAGPLYRLLPRIDESSVGEHSPTKTRNNTATNEGEPQ
ncbi:MAG: DUF2723 domain-containing protein [Oscillochloris sp.]|nr:DUF2723 domain-containing protein [Oscillochloris sp.]